MSTSGEVVVFACNWDGWSCIEAAAHDRLCYPASVRIIRVNCLSRVHLGLIMKAFELGAAGVLLLGCEAGECHYGVDSNSVVREYEKAQGVLSLAGIGSEKVVLHCLTRGDGEAFAHLVTEFAAKIGGLPEPVPIPELKRKKLEPPPWRFRIEG